MNRKTIWPAIDISYFYHPVVANEVAENTSDSLKRGEKKLRRLRVNGMTHSSAKATEWEQTARWCAPCSASSCFSRHHVDNNSSHTVCIYGWSSFFFLSRCWYWSEKNPTTTTTNVHGVNRRCNGEEGGGGSAPLTLCILLIQPVERSEEHSSSVASDKKTTWSHRLH